MFSCSQCPGGWSQLGTSSEEGLNDGRIPAADGPIQRPHPLQIDVFQHGAFLQQDLW